MSASVLPRTATRKFVATTTAALFALVAFTACSPEEPTKEKAAGQSDDGDKGKGSEKSDEKSGQLKPGEVAAYKNGLKITVSKATAYTPGQYATGHDEGNKAYQVTITLENTGDKNINAALIDVSARAGEDGVDADKVFDSTNKVENLFKGKLLPNKKATALFAFSAPADAKHLDVEAGLIDFTTEPAQWKLPL